jgi:hypothetical protein
VPFTRATTASEADDDELEAEEDEFLEQPTAAGSTNSASAAIVATARGRGRAVTVEFKAVFGKVDFSNVMAAVLGKCADPPDWRRRRTVAQSLSLCNGSIKPDFDDSVSKYGRLTRM